MDTQINLLSPLQTFEDNLRPAHLLVSVYRLLDSNDNILTGGDTVQALRGVIQAADEEDLMLIYNQLFLGLVRESAQLPRSTLRQATLRNLLRQAVVASATALETYLPALLRTNMPLVIRVRGREAVPKGDPDVGTQFKSLPFNLDEVLRLITEPNPEEYISGKLLGSINFSYLSGSRGVAVTGKLLGLPDPWAQIAQLLAGDPELLPKTVRDTIDRRNDIVHRADRPQSAPGGKQQTITYSWTKQAVDTIDNVCHALDELVTAQVVAMQAMLAPESEEQDGVLSDGQSAA